MSLIRKCLFPAAGYGTRFLPATKAVPKEMLPLVDKPLIQYGVEEAAAAGLDVMAFVTGRGKQALEDHFDINPEIDRSVKGSDKEQLLADLRRLMDACTFTVTRQGEMKGLGHAILAGQPLIGDEPFAVILPDDVCHHEGDGVLKQMADLYEQYRCSIVAVEEVPRERVGLYGVIAGNEEAERVLRITDMVEKPAPVDAPSNLAIIGRYILTPDIFECIRATKPGRGGEIQITDAILQQARRGKVIGYRFRGRRFDCGIVSGFVEATNFFHDLRGDC